MCPVVPVPDLSAERRKNSQLAREIELAIPHELPQDAARETVLAFVRENFVSQG
ncbi:MobA/MobL family protein, partial [Escherichia coli]|uniref:MobA/MobL family protein n=1 Tax=Escherichia coli TaxID=562 RepID=UPI003EE2C4EB